MNNITKGIIHILLIVGLLSTQFAYASSPSTVEQQEQVLGVYEAEVNESCDFEIKMEEIESTNENDVGFDDYLLEYEDDLNVEEPQNQFVPENIKHSANNAEKDFILQNPSLRDSYSNYFSGVSAAAVYLDEQIIEYIYNDGPSDIEINFQYNQGEEYKIYQIAYYSHLYNALCGYGLNFTYSIQDEDIITYNSGNEYHKYTYNLESTLSNNQIEETWTIAQDIADDINLNQPLEDILEDINYEINHIVDYHHECNPLTTGDSPDDGCDTAYALSTGDGICSGFTGAFCLVCYLSGLDVIPLLGYVRQPADYYGEFHAWNLVKNGSKWLQADCTFNLPHFDTDIRSTRGVYNYFTDNFKGSHEIDTTNSGLYQTTTGYTYIDQHGYSIASMWLHYPSYSCYFEKDACMAVNRWLDIGEDRYYFLNNGHMATSTMMLDQGRWRYLNGSGQITRSQWIQYNGYWYYFKENGFRAEGEWIQDNTDWCYLGADGKMVTNDWAQDSVGWCYMDGSGHITRSQWLQKNNNWYYLKSNGYRAQSEWIQDSTDWCYLGFDGKMVTSEWAQDSVGWCYLDSTGHITRSQWLQKNNEWYYLKADGHMAANEWAQDSVGWCYMDSSGHITRSQWLLKNGYWYYLKADGHMAVNEWIEDSVGWCYLGADGKMVTNNWVQDSAGWCYMDSTGHKTRSAWIQNGGYWYYLKSNGYRAESEWAQDSAGYCWMQSNGRWDSGTKWIGSPRNIGSSYIVSGHRIDSQTIAIDGYNCTFNGIGKLTSFVQITEPTPEPV